MEDLESSKSWKLVDPHLNYTSVLVATLLEDLLAYADADDCDRWLQIILEPQEPLEEGLIYYGYPRSGFTEKSAFKDWLYRSGTRLEADSQRWTASDGAMWPLDLSRVRRGPILCAIVEEVGHREGWRTCAQTVILEDGTYARTEFCDTENSCPIDRTFHGTLESGLLQTMTRITRESDRFSRSQGIPVYAYGIENSKITVPDDILSLMYFFYRSHSSSD